MGNFNDYKLYEQKVKEINNKNDNHLKNFSKWLEHQKLSHKTINNHVNNVDFYINDYLCYYKPQDFKEGCNNIDGFLGDWFIRKAMWASPAHIKSNAASIKKFYSFMLEESKISKENYDYLCKTIKEYMSEWIEKMEEYDNMVYDEC